MFHCTVRPAAELSELVDCFWYLSDAPGHAREHVVPSGTVELVVNLNQDEIRVFDPRDPTRCRRLSGAVVSGVYRRHFVIDTAAHASIVGVHFKPGGARPVLGLPAGELGDRHVDLEALWGPRARELRERLCAAPDAPARFRVLETALGARLSPERLHPATRIALDQLSRRSSGVGALAAELGLGHRRLTEVFRDDVGVTPKAFARLRRFQRTLDRIRRGPPDWARLALDCGYFDQSHLIREFVELSGMPPTELVVAGAAASKENHLAR